MVHWFQGELIYNYFLRRVVWQKKEIAIDFEDKEEFASKASEDLCCWSTLPLICRMKACEKIISYKELH